MKNGWTKIGEIGVDTGTCWIGDPCRVIHTDETPLEIGKNWKEFCEQISWNDVSKFGVNGELGLCVQTGRGDGYYPVEIRRENGVIAELRVKFL